MAEYAATSKTHFFMSRHNLLNVQFKIFNVVPYRLHYIQQEVININLQFSKLPMMNV